MFGFESLEDVHKLCKLSAEAPDYMIRVYRQSGNLHQDDRYASTKEEAIKLALGTLKRARKYDVRLNVNTARELSLHGMYNARGRQEGKKVGEVQIIALGVSKNMSVENTPQGFLQAYEASKSKPKTLDTGIIKMTLMILILVGIFSSF